MKVKADIFYIAILVVRALVSMIIILHDMFDAIHIKICLPFSLPIMKVKVKTGNINLC